MKKMLGRFLVWHRLLALPSCIFFGVWFLSGVVMMYARMPELTEADRLSRLPSLDLSTATPFPTKLLTSIEAQRITIGMLNGRPAYRILLKTGRWFSVYADGGSLVGTVDAHSAIPSAAEF